VQINQRVAYLTSQNTSIVANDIPVLGASPKIELDNFAIFLAAPDSLPAATILTLP
jgi:hypothetical protein